MEWSHLQYSPANSCISTMKGVGINNRILLINIYSTVNIYSPFFFIQPQYWITICSLTLPFKTFLNRKKLHVSFQIPFLLDFQVLSEIKLKIHLNHLVKLWLLKKCMSKITKIAKRPKYIWKSGHCQLFLWTSYYVMLIKFSVLISMMHKLPFQLVSQKHTN